MSHHTPFRLSLQRLLVDGAIIGTAFTVVVVASLWIDARLWLADYPPDIRAAVGEDAAAPAVLRGLVGLVVVTVLLGGLIYSNRRLWHQAPAAYGWATALGHTFVLFWLVNAVDVVVVDWLFLVTLRPDFVVFPGTEGLAGYGDYGFHFWASFGNWKPWLGSLLLAAAVALIAPWWWGHDGGRNRMDESHRAV